MQCTHRTPYPGGAPANLACAIKKLGTQSAFLSALGKDDLAEKMISLLKGALLGLRERILRAQADEPNTAAEIGVDITDLQRNDKPTRDVLVTFTKENDREFVGFGSAKNDEFADCFLEAGKLPLDKLKVQQQASATLCSFCPGPERPHHSQSCVLLCTPT